MSEPVDYACDTSRAAWHPPSMWAVIGKPYPDFSKEAPMSTVSKYGIDPVVASFNKFIAHFEANPGPDTAALAEEGKKAIAGLIAASVDFPALIEETTVALADLGKLAVDVMAKSPAAIPDAVAAFGAIKAEIVTASDAIAKAKAGAAA